MANWPPFNFLLVHLFGIPVGLASTTGSTCWMLGSIAKKTICWYYCDCWYQKATRIFHRQCSSTVTCSCWPQGWFESLVQICLNKVIFIFLLIPFHYSIFSPAVLSNYLLRTWSVPRRCQDNGMIRTQYLHYGSQPSSQNHLSCYHNVTLYMFKHVTSTNYYSIFVPLRFVKQKD